MIMNNYNKSFIIDEIKHLINCNFFKLNWQIYFTFNFDFNINLKNHYKDSLYHLLNINHTLFIVKFLKLTLNYDSN